MSIQGTWHSEVGSVLELEENGNEVTGRLDSTGDSGAFHEVHGSVDPRTDSNFRPLSFSVAWEGDFHSVTSYTGQYSNVDGNEQIEVVFLIANATESRVLWKSVGISSDIFTRTQPAE